MSASSSYLTSPVVGTSSPLALADTKTFINISPSVSAALVPDASAPAVSAPVVASGSDTDGLTITDASGTVRHGLSTAEYWRIRYAQIEKENAAEEALLASAAASGGIPLSDISGFILEHRRSRGKGLMMSARPKGADDLSIGNLSIGNKIDYLVSGMQKLTYIFDNMGKFSSGASSGAKPPSGMNSGLFTPLRVPSNSLDLMSTPAPALNTPSVTVENTATTQDNGSTTGPTTGGGRRTRNRKRKNKKRTRRSKH